MNLFNFLPFFFFSLLCNFRMLRVTFPLCVGVCGEREREEDGRLERRCSVKRPGQGGRLEEPGVSGAPTHVRAMEGTQMERKHSVGSNARVYAERCPFKTSPSLAGER